MLVVDFRRAFTNLKPFRVLFGVISNLLQDFCEPHRRFPSPASSGERGIHYDPGYIEWAEVQMLLHLTLIYTATAPPAQFGKRHRVHQAAPDIPNPVHLLSVGISELSSHQRGQISRMKSVSDLKTISSEADVAQSRTSTPGVDPKGKNALFRCPKLAGACEHPAAIDPYRKLKRSAIFQRQD